MEVKTFTEDEQKALLSQHQEFIRMQFANLKKSIVQDLINNRYESVIFRKYKKEDIIKMLEDPQKNVKKIREFSGFLYMVSSHYRRLVDYSATILLYNYTVVPAKVLPKKYKKKDLQDSYYQVISECSKYNFKHEATKAMRILARDGIFFGLCFENEDSFFIKSIPYTHAQISSIEDGVYRFAVDLNYFNGQQYLLPMYGQGFVRAYEIYKGDKDKGIAPDKTKRWYEPKNGICLVSDESNPYTSLPFYVGIFKPILDLDEYAMLQKAKTENDNFHVIAAELPLDEDGFPKIDSGLATKWFDGITSGLEGSGTGAILSPFKLTDFSFQGSNSSDRNIVSDATDQVYQASGISSGIFGSTNITASAALLLSVKPDEAMMFAILLQFERFFNMKIKKMNLPVQFKVKFTQQSIFNQDEYVNRLTKVASLGVPIKLELASSLGMSPSDIMGATQVEEALGLSKNVWVTPLVSSNTQGVIDNQGGRPTAEEKGEGVSESSEQTRDSGANANR